MAEWDGEVYREIPLPPGSHAEDCPYCGHSGQLYEFTEDGDHYKKVVCCTNNGDDEKDILHCPQYLPNPGFYKSTKKEALAVWNKRITRHRDD